MNGTQVAAMRNLWTSVTSLKVEYTARDFELNVPHSLDRQGRAITPSGQVWVWVNATERWTQA